MSRHYRLKDLQRISLDNAMFRERQQRRDILRANRQQREKDKRAEQKTEIEQMHYYGHECTLSPEELAELRERVRHRPWRQTW